MGGALAVHAVHSNRMDAVVGLGVIDVVEGSAMESLSVMGVVINSRPKHFASVEGGVVQLFALSSTPSSSYEWDRCSVTYF
ncbi:unnamed protein product [Anisakis simplex]|uniref:Protein phosphatase methylesterase-1 n=1 Tax=Anisakis simplex TaxID=6269 RepID=A0A0M3JG69_ANISI|nr:unnamed protein product [Anisakis simplex]